MPVLLLPHRDEIRVYVSEEGYVTITQQDITNQGMQNIVSVHYSDVPALLEALDIAARKARRSEDK